MHKNKIVKFVLKLLVSLIFVAWLVFNVDWLQVWGQARQLSLLSISLYILVLLCGIAVSALKWRMLLAHKKIDVSLKRCFQLYLTGTFINNFMPSVIGGDTYRSFQAGKESKRYGAAGMSVVFDRITGLFAAMLLTGVFAVFNWEEIAAQAELKLSVIIVLLAMHAFIFFGILSRFSFWTKIAERLPNIVGELGKELAHYREGGVYLKAIGYSIVFNFIGLALLNWVLFMGLGITIGALQYLSVIFLISIISALPVSINNIGIKEWAYVTFFGFFGVAASAVVAVALVSRILQMLVSFTALPMYLKSKK